MSLQNAQLLAAEREQRTFTEAMRDTAAALNSTLNVDEVLDRVLANIERVVPHDIANIMLINLEDDQPVARVARCHGYDRIAPELDAAVRQLRFPVMTVANLRQMLETGQPFIVGDTHAYPGWIDSPSTRWQRSYVGAPIHLRDSVIGFIQLDSREVDFFTPVAAERLQTFANQTAVAIENAQLFQAEREQHALAEALRDTASVLAGTLDFDEVLDRILSTVGRIVPNDVATLLLIEQGVARVMRAVGYRDAHREAQIRRLRFVIAQTPNLLRVIETQRPWFIADTATDPAWTHVDGIDWIKSNIVAPMIINGQVIGMLALDSSLVDFYTSLHAERLQIFAVQSAVALENAQLFDETQQRLKELAVLFDGSRAMTASLDRATVLQTIAQRLAEAVDATSVYVLSIDLVESVVHMLAEYFSPGANELERVSDLGATYRMDDLPETLAALRRGQAAITVIDDPQAEPVAVKQLRTYGGQSSLRVPMNVAGTVRAYAVIWDSRTPRHWTEAEVQLCQTLANQAAVALENVRLLEETRQGLKEQSALLAASTAVSSSLDLMTVLKRLAEQMGRALDATSVYVCEWNQAANTSTVVVEYYAPAASEQERISDLGVTYNLATDYGIDPLWQQAGRSQVIHVDDPGLPPNRAAHLRQYGCWSVLTVGLTARANVFGFIELWESRQRRTFTPDEIALCQAIAQQAAIAFENARLFEAERKQLRLAQTLQAVGALLTAQMSLNEVFDYIFDLLARVVAYDSVSVQLVDDDRLALAAGRGFPNTALAGEIIRSVSRQTLEERWGAAHLRVITLPDTSADPRWIVYPGSEYIRSWIGAALRVKGRLLGILNVDSATPGAYTEELGETVAAFANQAAIAIENAQLHEAVRRHADELEERVIERTVELEHERKRTTAILDTAGEGIIFTDASGTVEYINQAMERLTGYTAGEALRQNPRLWKSGQTSPALYHELWDTIKRGRIWQGELVNRRKDGHLYDAALTVAPLYDADGRLAGFVGVQHDITQRKELDRLKDEFVSNVSHELRTPIANVKLYLSLLTRGKPERHDEYLQTLRRESARLETLIENLLDLSRLDLDTTKVVLEPVDLNQLTAQLITDRTALATSRQHTIDYQTDERRLLALADPAALSQVFTNLLTNAINYTPPNGLITVSVARREHAGQTWATIAVKDTGPGISPADLPHLFQRFYRGEAGRKSGAPGTGLGLAISDKIVDRLGGQLTVYSQPGHGATFTVWLKPT
jgi:PAS domain S-box-containing protein